MKLIHMADCHLDAEFGALFRGEEAVARRRELLMTFLSAVDYAAENGFAGILISGDLFDGKLVSETTGNTVLRAMKEHPGIRFFYLKGNHDEGTARGNRGKRFPEEFEEVPENLTVFGETETVEFDCATVTGIDIASAGPHVYENLDLPAEKTNIVLLHGQIRDAFGENDRENIPLRSLREKNIDYLALGHLHTYRSGELDARGIYAYSGCLEGRGFDECGEKGFVELDISEETGRVSAVFKAFSKRKLMLLNYDISNDESTGEVLSGVTERMRETGVSGDYGVKLVLSGTFNPENEWNPGVVEARFRENFRLFRLKDETKPRVNFADYAGEVSLKGEFVRLLENAPGLTEEEKAEIIRVGLSALRGEEPV